MLAPLTSCRKFLMWTNGCLGVYQYDEQAIKDYVGMCSFLGQWTSACGVSGMSRWTQHHTRSIITRFWAVGGSVGNTAKLLCVLRFSLICNSCWTINSLASNRIGVFKATYLHQPSSQFIVYHLQRSNVPHASPDNYLCCLLDPDLVYDKMSANADGFENALSHFPPDYRGSLESNAPFRPDLSGMMFAISTFWKLLSHCDFCFEFELTLSYNLSLRLSSWLYGLFL